jgi:hypothetical protein
MNVYVKLGGHAFFCLMLGLVVAWMRSLFLKFEQEGEEVVWWSRGAYALSTAFFSWTSLVALMLIEFRLAPEWVFEDSLLFRIFTPALALVTGMSATTLATSWFLRYSMGISERSERGKPLPFDRRAAYCSMIAVLLLAIGMTFLILVPDTLRLVQAVGYGLMGVGIIFIFAGPGGFILSRLPFIGHQFRS